MKKLRVFAGLMAFVCVLTFCSCVAAANVGTDVFVSLQIDNPIMEVNGKDTEIDPGRNTKPIVTNGRTLVPIRAIIEAFGGSVGWDAKTRSVLLSMDGDTIKLVIDQNIAYLNNKSETLDVAPTVINDRTMLPLRFVAEGFNLGVAWDGKSRTVSVIKDTLTDAENQYLKGILPAYSNGAYVYVNNNVPFFKTYERIGASFEYYSKLDGLRRCDVCYASVAEDVMPTEKRESISSVTPSGWLNKRYDNVDGGYLYNRCHLIGFQLTGENANDRNLITGTRYLNISGMLPFENKVADYVKTTNNHVLYRATPVFSGNNLVADGVLIEAYSVEDNGRGISFCVYCYNVQPDISIDYKTGESFSAGENNTPSVPVEEVVSSDSGIYRTPTGKRYHFDPGCGGKNSYAVTMSEALAAGLTPCKKCAD